MLHTVIATREGLVGKETALNWIINNYIPFVALPSEMALRQWVTVINPLTNKSINALVLDVGPHHIDDDAYVFGGARPRAESENGNKSGIDLGENVWNAIGMLDNTKVTWKFVSG